MTQFNEGLRPNDLVDMIFDNFEVDSFKSKMGEDRDVCVVSFRARDRAPAKDMMEFIEKGYNFVLDADVSAGEDKDGLYHIFVELKRTPDVYEHIQELIDGIKRLTSINEWKFKYHKNSRFQTLDEQTLKSLIPSTPDDYDMMVETIRVESIKRFFSKTFKTELIIEGNKITVIKPFGNRFSFNLVEFGKVNDLQVKITETCKIDTKSMAEVMWLTKVLGDFNITKYGDQFVLEDGKKSMIIKMEEQ